MEKSINIIGAATSSTAKKVSTPSSSANLPDLKVVSCILGGALAHLTLGTLFCWSNFMSYAPSFLSFFDGIERTGVQADKMLVIPFTLVAMCVTMPIGPIVVGKIGSQKTMFIGTLLVSLGVFLSAYAKNLLTFILCYSGLFGAGVGISYAAPMIAGWKWLPNAKGLVSGVILTGFGAGGFIFNLLGTSFVNPKGLNPSGDKFPVEVYDAFPLMLKKLALIYFVVGSIGAAMISVPAAPAAPIKGKTQTSPAVQGVGVMEAIKTPQFWILWAMIILSASAGLNVAAVYKKFATTIPLLSSDSYLTLVGATGAIFNGLGRLFWGSISDKIGFKNSFTLLAAIQAVLLVIFPYSTHSKTAFIVAFSMVYFLLAGNFALMPPAAQRIFGTKNGSVIYGILYTSFASASIGGIFLMKPLIASLGWNSLFRTMAALSLGATAVTTFLKPLKSLPSSTV
jgi:OFA family oxalate/formate antiporter-like MFS transporter